MLRCILAIIFTVCTLGVVSFDLTFKDGLHLTCVGWPEKFQNWLKARKERKH